MTISPGSSVGARTRSTWTREDGAVHGTVDDERRDDPDTAQGGDEGGGLPVSLRHPADQTRPPPASALGPRHLAQVSSMKTSRLGSNGG